MQCGCGERRRVGQGWAGPSGTAGIDDPFADPRIEGLVAEALAETPLDQLNVRVAPGERKVAVDLDLGELRRRALVPAGLKLIQDLALLGGECAPGAARHEDPSDESKHSASHAGEREPARLLLGKGHDDLRLPDRLEKAREADDRGHQRGLGVVLRPKCAHSGDRTLEA